MRRGSSWSAETRQERADAETRSWFKKAVEKVIAGAQPKARAPRPDRSSALVCVPGEPLRIIKREDRGGRSEAEA